MNREFLAKIGFASDSLCPLRRIQRSREERMRNILFVYYSTTFFLRPFQREHLLSFHKYSGHRCFYLNLAVQRVPRYFYYIPFDLIVYDWFFLGVRWNREVARKGLNRARALKSIEAVKIALPQDECNNSDWLCNFINEFKIDIVFSVASDSQWPVIYSNVDFKKTKFFRVLPGYIEETIPARIASMAQEISERSIDIGYRTGYFPAFGRQGLLKSQLAETFQRKAEQYGVVADISSQAKDFLAGDDWYRFLLRCKYTLGVESGASLLDRDGCIWESSLEYLEHHPEASFQEVEAACFPRLDGNLELYAISPRHLEACATRTCQILIEGDYNGILKAGEHYIELKRDFSNVDQLMELVRQDTLRTEITERAHRDIVESGQYTYRSFVQYVLERALPDIKLSILSPSDVARSRVLYIWMRFRHWLSWGMVALISLRNRWLKKILPMEVVTILRKIDR